MKKTVLLSLMLLCSMFSSAQYFKAAKDGVVEAGGEKSYIVEEVPGVSAKELYQRACAYVVAHYRSPKDVMSTLENQLVNIHCYVPNAYRCRVIGNMADVDMNIMLQFKEGRYRMEVAVNDQVVRTFYKHGGVRFNSNDHPEYHVSVTMFRKDGSVKTDIAVRNFNTWINGYTAPLIEWMREPHGASSVEDDW